MIKADIVHLLERQLGLSHEEASAQVEYILAMLKDELEHGDSVLISGFGQWKVRRKTSRIGRNPKTGEQYQVSPRRVVSFQVSPVWRSLIGNTNGTELSSKRSSSA